ncbi:MAG: CinA family protein [Pseudomonadota bacterium]|uniref:CinA family protein n=1 Tax=Sulfuricystis thermophila TaxID=2496847 RepID=UPI001035A9FA|nr:nicotinamide-nucleotide amidohydrolase family protein [Sulfuricystis thermophila]
MDAELVALSEAVGQICQLRGLMIATAESCTGGWAAQVITHTPGSSAWFERGFVTYANAAKVDMLGVRMFTIETFGAVSLETAGEMAAGALAHSNATISLAITGIAGPSGGSPEKPVGTVCFGWCLKEGVPVCERRLFAGDREAIRRQSVIHALTGLIALARNMP